MINCMLSIIVMVLFLAALVAVTIELALFATDIVGKDEAGIIMKLINKIRKNK